jgi:RHS repeat-associated protein
MLPDVGLIHMNGRIYDPLIGRFLSADPSVEAQYNPQNWNRYAYVGNNPMRFTDPTGYCFLGCFFESTAFRAIGAIVVAIAAREFLPAYLEVVVGAELAEPSAVVVGGMAAGAIQSESHQGALLGGASALAFYGVGSAIGDLKYGDIGDRLELAAAHGVVGGLVSVAQGGKFQSGFLAAGIADLVARAKPGLNEGIAGRRHWFQQMALNYNAPSR